jgi:hypothetical protein
LTETFYNRGLAPNCLAMPAATFKASFPEKENAGRSRL